MFGCEADKIGNGECNAECQHQLTGNDGGDCDKDYVACDQVKVHNGNCDPECNKADHNWDGGDCCVNNAAQQLTCFDPHSPNR